MSPLLDSGDCQPLTFGVDALEENALVYALDVEAVEVETSAVQYNDMT